MTNPTFEKSLNTILNDLEKGPWATPFIEIAEKYHPLQDEDLDYETETLNMLLQLKSEVLVDPSLPLERLVAMRFSALNCWNFRICSNVAKHAYLNPLTDSLALFQEASVSVTQSTSPFPPPDIIKRWARDKLR